MNILRTANLPLNFTVSYEKKRIVYFDKEVVKNNFCNYLNSMKNHISQALEYHGMFKVNIIFQSNFWLKNRISHLGKVQSKNFSVISKYHLSINFLVKKDRIYHLRKIKTGIFQ